MPEYLILGAGFTGSRVARRLHERGLSVVSIRRAQIDFTQRDALEKLRSIATPGCVVLHSVPSLVDKWDARLLEALEKRARRVVYLSTTGVYGNVREVNECTPVAPDNERSLARVETERRVSTGPWECLILRPAAIYGPGRGLHVAMRDGRFRLLGDGSNFISRIYVEDLARIVEAALLSVIRGAFPVADARACSSAEIAGYCAELLRVPMPELGCSTDVPESRRANRKVDGSAICRLLGVELQFPSYREGIPAAMRADQVK